MAGLYLHIPFCEKKCIYCDFFSVESVNNFDVFSEILIKEIQMYKNNLTQESVETIYFGGGTPSLLNPKHFEKILSAIYNQFSLTNNPEITVEVNPGTVNYKKLSDYKKIGINRLSVGVQSLVDEDLRFLTRIHNVADVVNCIDDARKAGFDNLGIDLIFAVPTQTLKSWENILDEAIKLEPDHISVYNLSVEKDTPLAEIVKNKKASLLGEEIESKMFVMAVEKLTSSGFMHYEISNYAKPDFESKHNCNYWNHSNYLGFGPSAHSYWNTKRWWNIDTLAKYYSRISSGILPIKGNEDLTRHQLISEMIMLGLRTRGVNFHHLKLKYKYDYKTQLQKSIAYLLTSNLAVLENEVLSLTRKGILICDEISKMLISDID